jgi:mRNA interferase RelE/StbE
VDPRYTVEMLPAADKDLDRLPAHVLRRIGRRLDGLMENPRPSGVESITGRAGYYRVRVGDYRIVYSVDDHERLVAVVLVGHRQDVYRRLQQRI